MFVKPTIGRIVWYYPDENDSGKINLDKDKGLPRSEQQPMGAKVAYVHNDRLVNLAVSDHEGFLHTQKEVTLIQEGDELPADGGEFCAWMPYQQAQAAKAAAEQASISTPPAP